MINAEEIDRTILELEQHDTTYATVEKLAWLYIVRDHLSTPAQINTSGRSELLNAIEGKDAVAVWNVIDDHMNMIRALYPREYNAVLNRLRAI